MQRDLMTRTQCSGIQTRGEKKIGTFQLSLFSALHSPHPPQVFFSPVAFSALHCASPWESKMSSNQQYDDSAYDPQQGSDPYLDDQHPSHDGHDGDQQHHDGQQDKSSGIHHEEGKMFIGGLNWETTDDSLREYFSKFGDVTDCVVMKEPGTGKSRGFGFLTFVDPSVVDNVLKQEHHLDGKMIDPKRAIPREEQDKTEKIFVGGIAPEVTEDEFKDYFGQFGHVIDATLMTDRETGRPRGFGFITFESDKGVEEAMKRTDLAIRDKQIEVKKAMPKHKAQQARMMQNLSTMSMSNLGGNVPSSSLSMSGSIPTSTMSSLGYDPRAAAYAAAAIGRGYGASATPSSRYQGAATYGVAANGKNGMTSATGYDSRYAAYSGYSGYNGYGYNGYGSYSDYSRRGYDPTSAMAAYYGRGYGYSGYGTGTGTSWGTSMGTGAGTGRGSYGYGGMTSTSGRSSGYDGYSGTSGYGASTGTTSGATAGTYARGYGREDGGGYGQTAATGNGGGEFSAGSGRTEVYDRRVSGGGSGGATRTATSPGASGASDRGERGAGRSGSSGPSSASGVGRGTAGFQGANGNGGGGAIYTTQAVRNQHSYHPYR